MTIDDVVRIVKRIHDAEGYNLGASSTREYRNQFFSRAIGCVYHGHPVYNPTPDRQWHLKDGGGGRPQSDDVTVSQPSRQAWDCIPGAGANGYYFEAHAIGVLPADQNVYPPPVPSPGGVPGPTPTPPAPALKPRAQFYAEFQQVNAFYAASEGLKRPGGMVIDTASPVRADAEAMGAWGYDLMMGKTVDQCIKEIRQSDEWKAKHPGETP